jgi:hypothetical protein
MQNRLLSKLFYNLCGISAFALFATQQMASGHELPKHCSKPTPKSCILDDDLCSLKVCDYAVQWNPVYTNDVLTGFGPVISYPGCDSEVEDCPRDNAAVMHCEGTQSRIDGNSLPGSDDEKVCAITRNCQMVAALGGHREWIYPRDAAGNDITTLPGVSARWAICQSFAASADPSYFDTPIMLVWVSCTPHDNCQRLNPEPEAGGQ